MSDGILSKWDIEIASKYKGRYILLFSLFPLFFLKLSLSYFGFTLDDAYITARYGSHLAQDYGIEWNIGTDPVEGYTSTLWMLLSASATVVGIDPIQFLKLIGIVAVLLTAAVIGYYGHKTGSPPGLILGAVATLVVNPAMAVLAVQGMETTLAMLFIAGASVATLQLTPGYQVRWGIVLGSCLLLGMLTRPEITLFAGGILAGLFGFYLLNDTRDDAVKIFTTGVVFLFIPGVIFVISRWLYFGYPLPNSFYIKEASGLISTGGVLNAGEFLAVIVGPIVLVGVYAAVVDPESRRVLEYDLLRCLPLVMGIGLFLSVWAFISPIQGFLWRFQAPVLPAILLVLLFLTRHTDTLRLRSRISAQNILKALIIVSLIGFPIHTFDEAHAEMGDRNQEDRVKMGQSLADLSDENYKMVVSESGAVPYYSEWNAIDDLGLNSEHIAHQGLSQQYLQEYSPDLVLLLLKPQEGLFLEKSPIVARYLEDENFKLVMTAKKTGTTTQYHAYFVNENSAGYQEISCTLLETDGVEKVSNAPLIEFAEIDMQSAKTTPQDC